MSEDKTKSSVEPKISKAEQKKQRKAEGTKLEASLELLMKLDRQRRRWRFFTLLFLLVTAWFVFAGKLGNVQNPVQPFVAQVNIEGMILDTSYEVQVLDQIAKNDKVKALHVHIDSPGGTMVDGLELYKALRRVAANKPVVATMGNAAASAGYLVGLGADYILANEATLTGSIGVVLPLVDITELGDKVGVKSDMISSGRLKMVESPLHKRTERDRLYLQNMANRLDDIFMNIVTERRELSEETQTVIADSRAIIGADAVEMNLVDATGSYIEARDWLANFHNIKQNMPIKTYDMEETEGFLDLFLSKLEMWPFAMNSHYGAMAVYQ